MKFLKIFDLYGSQFHFYINKKPKYYTTFGGITTIFSAIICFAIFIILSLDDLKRVNPLTNLSSVPLAGYQKVNLKEKKIYVPWRIVDYSEKFVNHKGVIHPKIYYYKGEKNEELGEMILDSKELSYNLCNETDMSKLTEDYILDIPLNELYCIDIEDLQLGGSWYSDFVFYIEFDLYLCKNAEKYDKFNENCTSYEELKNYYGNDNAWLVEVFYPVVQFQPNNLKYPIVVLFKSFFYNFSKYSNKIDRIYLQEHILTDEQGWILNFPKEYSYWGFVSLTGDSYTNGEDDILGEGSNSRLYSLNIYLDPGKIFYSRKYKKLYAIIGEIFPILNGVLIIIGGITKLFSSATINKKIIEYMTQKINTSQLLIKLNNSRIDNSFWKNTHSLKIDSQILDLGEKKNKKKKSICENSSSIIFKKPNILEKQLEIKNLKEKNIEQIKLESENKNINENILCLNNLKGKAGTFQGQNLNIIKRKSISLGLNRGNKNSTFKNVSFPSIYYLIGFIINKIKKIEHISFLPKKFIWTYRELTNLIDISTYISFLREFTVIKKILMSKEQVERENIK